MREAYEHISVLDNLVDIPQQAHTNSEMGTQSALIGCARLIVKVFTFAVAIVVATGTGRAEDERRVIEGEAFIHDLQPVTLELQGQFLFGDEFNRINELSRDAARHQIRLRRSKIW